MEQKRPYKLKAVLVGCMLGLLSYSCTRATAIAEDIQSSPPKVVTQDLAKALPDAMYTLRMAYTDVGSWPAAGNKPLAEHAFALIFKSIVESRTNGEVSIELFPGNTLAQSKEATEMVQNGTLELAITTGATAAFYPEIQVISLPYAFRSDEVAWRFFDESPYWKNMVEDMADKTGIRVLGVGQNGTRHFTNSVRPIRTPADMRGLKIRVMQSPIFSQMVNALGATAIPLTHNEIYTSLQTGVADGQENPVWNIAANKWYEVQTYMTLDGHVWSENMLIINDNYFQGLPVRIQQVIRIAALQGQWADRVSESLASRVTDYNILNERLEIYSPTAEEIGMFKDAVAPVKDWLKGQIDASLVDNFYLAVQRVEQDLGY